MSQSEKSNRREKTHSPQSRAPASPSRRLRQGQHGHAEARRTDSDTAPEQAVDAPAEELEVRGEGFAGGAAEEASGDRAEDAEEDAQGRLVVEEDPDPVEVASPEGAAPPADESVFEDTETYLVGLVEAVLFVSEGPVSLKDLARACRVDQIRAGELVARLQDERRLSGVRLEQVADGLVLRTNPIYAEYLRGYLAQRPVRLSRAQLETLSIVAYRQPITRPEMDDIRGVDCGPVLKGLLERDLVRILGKKDEPGRPMLYGTTPHFLAFFNLRSLQELPTLKEFTELNAESRETFERETGEDPPEQLQTVTPPGESTPGDRLASEGDAGLEGVDGASRDAVDQTSGGEPGQGVPESASSDEGSDASELHVTDEEDEEDEEEDDEEDEEEDDEEDDEEDEEEDEEDEEDEEGSN